MKFSKFKLIFEGDGVDIGGGSGGVLCSLKYVDLSFETFPRIEQLPTARFKIKNHWIFIFNKHI